MALCIADAVNQMSAKIGSSPGGIEEFYVFPPPISTHFDFPLAILGPEVFISSNRQSVPDKKHEIHPHIYIDMYVCVLEVEEICLGNSK